MALTQALIQLDAWRACEKTGLACTVLCERALQTVVQRSSDQWIYQSKAGLAHITSTEGRGPSADYFEK